MRFSIEWLGDAANAAPEDRATVADLRMFVAGLNVTEHVDGGQGRLSDHITASLYPIAFGLAHRWWTLFGGRDVKHPLVTPRLGVAWPDVTLEFDGDAFEVETEQCARSTADVRFWTRAHEVAERADVEAELSRLVQAICDRLSSEGVVDTAAQMRWARVNESLADPNEAAFCEAAGALGLDPYALGEEQAAFIERSADVFTGQRLQEFLAGLASSPVTAINRGERALEWAEHVQRRPAAKSLLGDLLPLSLQVAAATPARLGERPWSVGYRRARIARRAMSLKEAQAFSGPTDLARRLGAAAFEAGAYVNSLKAMTVVSHDRASVHLRDRAASNAGRSSQMSAFGRAVGEVFFEPAEGRSVVNELHKASRQAAGRAFAAEFLAPIDAITGMLDEGGDVDAAAAHFGVDAAVIRHQIDNHRNIAEAVSSA